MCVGARADYGLRRRLIARQTNTAAAPLRQTEPARDKVVHCDIHPPSLTPDRRTFRLPRCDPPTTLAAQQTDRRTDEHPGRTDSSAAAAGTRGRGQQGAPPPRLTAQGPDGPPQYPGNQTCRRRPGPLRLVRGRARPGQQLARLAHSSGVSLALTQWLCKALLSAFASTHEVSLTLEVSLS